VSTPQEDGIGRPPVPPVALVTGAARRIGRAIALDLAARGFAVAVHHLRSADAAQDAVETIERSGGRAVALRADFADEAAVEGLMGAAERALGPVGLLVNSAAHFERDSVSDATRASWDAHMEINLRAPLVLCQAFARRLPERAHGLIVNLLDQRVWNLSAHYLSYTVSKSGLWTLTRTLALALAPRIRVNAVGPGIALPDTGQSENDFAAWYAAMPLGRSTSPDEICRAIRFILEAPSMTGQMIALDGGHHLAGPLVRPRGDGQDGGRT
jgi:NAD(P)-dependent dehydrogenase (short-subunit alcohol dehydrogenase family)